MTQEIYQTAIKFAGEKHSEQRVPGSTANYIVHIANVAMEVLFAHNANDDFDLDYAVQLALLHDSLEDTDATFEELAAEFGEPVAEGVQALTKNSELPTKQERMRDSLARIKVLPKEVGMVKLADRITNLQRPPGHWPSDKIGSYLEEAKLIRAELKDTNAFLAERIGKKIEAYAAYVVAK